MHHWGKIRLIGGRAMDFHILEQKLARDISENVCLGKERIFEF